MTPESPRIREATLEDAAALQRYVAGLFAERLPVLFQHEPPTLAAQREFVQRAVDSPGSVILIVELEDEVVGLLDFVAHPHPQRAHSGVFGMSVRRDCRSRGLGSRLLDALFDWALAHGIARLELEVFSSNPDAIRLYERKGFVHEGRRAHAARVGDRLVDLLVMARSVPPPIQGAERLPVPLLRRLHCYSLPVPDLDAALAFYRDGLGHRLIWRAPDGAGLRLPETAAELVLHTDERPQETDLLVESAPAAARRLAAAGGSIVAGPFEIRIGQCVVVEDPWGNRLVLLDLSKGLLGSDARRSDREVEP